MHSYTTRILVPLFCVLLLGASSCKKFLSAYSQNKSFIGTSKDLDELLVGTAYGSFELFTPTMLLSMDDDVQLSGRQSTGVHIIETGFHYWQPEPRVNSEGKLANNDPFYDKLYGKISGINTILYNVTVLEDKQEPAATLTRISGEAHFLRAIYYFMLVNIYGKPYKPATAATDFGVPLKTDPAIIDGAISRGSIQQTFDLILNDLLKAEQELEGVNESTTFRANKAAVQALLSRVYLYMENYEKAVLYANKVIDSENYLLTDLNNHTAGKDFLHRNSPEVIFTMGPGNMPTLVELNNDIPSRPYYRVSDELDLGYPQDDLRREIFFKRNSQGYLRVAKKRETASVIVDDVSDMFLLRLAEVYLNKAEALAALDRFDDARNTLQELRKRRFDPSTLTPIHLEGAALVNRIREERRLELCFETHRWFDLRRYGVNSKYPFSKSIRHRSIVYNGNGYVENGYYELGPYEQDPAAYIVPVAIDEIEFNRGQLTNEPRPERPLKQ